MGLMLTGDTITAQKAYRLGLVNRVVPLAELMPPATKMAERICENGRIGVRFTKEAFVRGQRMSLLGGIQMARLMAKRLVSFEDTKEGFKAFLEKRKPPEWKGR